MAVVEVEFLDVTEIDERGLRRLAESRGCLLTKTENSYQIIGAGIFGVGLTDDECWDVLAEMRQVETLSGRGVPVS